MFKILALVLLVSIPTISAILGAVGGSQSIVVTGKVVCNGQPMKDVLVKLYEDGTIYDSKLDNVKTSGDGSFRLTGNQKKIRKIDPKINIYHRCNHVGICPKKVTINAPKNAVSKGKNTHAEYDIGTLNLANKFPGEGTDCIH